MGITPNQAQILDKYETRNLNKAAYLLINGANYIDCSIQSNGMASIILSGVNKRYLTEFWKDELIIEFWTFFRKRLWLKDQIKEKTNINRQN